MPSRAELKRDGLTKSALHSGHNFKNACSVSCAELERVRTANRKRLPGDGVGNAAHADIKRYPYLSKTQVSARPIWLALRQLH
jgi:hypothetical protein